MPDAPSPDLVRAVRAGCDAIGEPNCKFPDCDCARVRSIRAALAELAAPSEEMRSAVPNYRHLAEHCWRAMMRRVLGGEL